MAERHRPLRHLPTAATDTLAGACGVVMVPFGAPIPKGIFCHYCDKPANTRDHIVAKANLGVDTWWNLVPCCARCNRLKGDKDTTCHCAYCTRAVFLWGLGHTRPVRKRRTQKLTELPGHEELLPSFPGST